MRVAVVALACTLASHAALAEDDGSAARVALTPPTEPGPALPPARASEPSSQDAAPALDPRDVPRGDARDEFDDLGKPGEVASGPTETLFGVLVKTMLMLALVVGAAYLTLHKGVGKLMARAQQGQRIKVVERVPLGERRSLYLVSIDGREMLLGVGEGGITPIAKPGSASGEARFSALLTSTEGRRADDADHDTRETESERRDDV